LQIAPNPTSEFINIQLQSNEARTIVVGLYDAVGKLISIQNWDVNHSNSMLHIDVNQLPSGSYLLQFIDEKTSLRTTKKVVVQR
jgi:hypothetical protein